MPAPVMSTEQLAIEACRVIYKFPSSAFCKAKASIKGSTSDRVAATINIRMSFSFDS
jgi:hypothetical protein